MELIITISIITVLNFKQDNELSKLPLRMKKKVTFEDLADQSVSDGISNSVLSYYC